MHGSNRSDRSYPCAGHSGELAKSCQGLWSNSPFWTGRGGWCVGCGRAAPSSRSRAPVPEWLGSHPGCWIGQGPAVAGASSCTSSVRELVWERDWHRFGPTESRSVTAIVMENSGSQIHELKEEREGCLSTTSCTGSNGQAFKALWWA